MKIGPLETSGLGKETQRRCIAVAMFGVLLASVGVLVGFLVNYAPPQGSDSNQYIQGVVLTAITGAIGAFLSMLTLIVKVLTDNMKESKDD